ncbi:MAG: HIT family protein [Betaproteobacteria bacterium]|nr:HIT family protein [Betaproteobacteria bacterium]
MAECIFCKIVARNVPATIVWEDERSIAFMDIGSVNPGHALVAAKPHVENIFELDQPLAAAVFQTTARIARALKQAFAPQGVTLYQANGSAAGQTVFHFHIHVVPRYEGDGMNLAWPIKTPPRSAIEEAAARIRAVL